METPFENALRKKEVDPEYFIERISNYPPDTWVMPTNLESNDYTVFSNLFEYNLVARKYVPIWSKGQLRGSNVFFMYNLDLKFEST
jgi:hypothetical protein